MSNDLLAALNALPAGAQRAADALMAEWSNRWSSSPIVLYRKNSENLGRYLDRIEACRSTAVLQKDTAAQTLCASIESQIIAIFTLDAAHVSAAESQAYAMATDNVEAKARSLLGAQTIVGE